MDLNSYGQFGRYALIRRISLGGMAEVFKAKSYTEAGFEKIVALKRLLPNIAENEDFVNMLIQEARIAARLDHPNICRIFELGQVSDAYYLTMEFIYGHDLRQALKAMKESDRRIDPYMAAWIGAQVAEALDYAVHATDAEGHALELVHRDISPQNVMIGFDGTVKVIDFGIAKVSRTTIQTAAGVLKGKYAYMSPEHAQQDALDSRSDIWSLGVVLHELLAGRRLFRGGSTADTIDQVLHAEVPRLTDTPEELAAIIERMLDRDRDARFPTHASLAEALRIFIAGSPQPPHEEGCARWMDTMFPADDRVEADLTDQEVRLVFSAEERGEETTDVRSDVSSATRIFLADETGAEDYRMVLQRLLEKGRVHTVITEGKVVQQAIARRQEAQDTERAYATLWAAGLTSMAFVASTWLLIAFL